MNKQIISLMCIAVCLAFALVVANEKWPDGYRTPPEDSGVNTSVGDVAKGPVILPEENPTEDAQHSVVTQRDAGKKSDASSADAKKDDTGPQGELVAIDSGTLKSDVPASGGIAPKNGVSSPEKTAPPSAKKPAPEKTTSAPKPNVAPAPKPAPKPEPKPAPKPAVTTGKATPKILLYTREAVLEIKADGPIRCKTFKLTAPDRLVVDLIGKWSVPVPTVPSNTIIQRVRVGEAPERTRIVLDLKRKLTVDKIVQVNASTINVRMQ